MNILVTGASRGIGHSLVKKFADIESVKKIVAISRDLKGLSELKSYSEKIETVSLDIAKAAKDPSLFNDVSDLLPSLDVVVNNAGYLLKKPFDLLEYKDINDVMDVNFTAPALLIKSLLPKMRRSAKSHIVNIGSMGGFQGSAKFPGLSIYSASKAALASLTECLSEEFKSSTVTFNCLALGAVQTEMFSEAFPESKAPISADDMAEFIKDFALNGNKYYKGKIIPVSMNTP